MVGFGELAEPGADSAGSASDLDARQDLGWIALLVLFAWGLRLVTLFRTSVIVNDGPIFLDIAQNMLEGQWLEALSAQQHPGYSFLVAILGHWTGDLQAAGQWVSLGAGGLAVAALYCFLIQAWNRRVAVFGSLLLAINPYAARLSVDVQSDSLYLLLFLVAIGLLFGALRSRRIDLALGAGFAAGLAYCVRPEALGVVLAGLALSLVAWLRGAWSTRIFVRWILALIGCAALMILPYLIFLSELTGSFTLSQKKSVLFMLGWTEGSAVASMISAPGAGGEWMPWLALGLAFGLVAVGTLVWIRRDRVARIRVGGIALLFCWLVFLAVGFTVRPSQAAELFAAVISALRPEVVLLIVIGVASRSRVDPSARSLFVVTVLSLYAVVFFALLLSYGYVVRRHVLPPFLLLLGYAGAGAWVLVGWVQTALSRRGGIWARLAPRSAIFLILLVTLIALPKLWRDHRSEQVASRRAAEWMAAETKGAGSMASDRLKHGWYAQREWRSTRVGGQPLSWPELYDGGVRWVLVDSLVTKRPDSNGSEEPAGNVGLEHESFDPVERYRVREGSREAVVWELVPR
ncbi:glycosyltransferase family 39 protein [Myxococcota bacterium]|nr:glycosyltransferase family 39 protein [Myxococcota bacterium]